MISLGEALQTHLAGVSAVTAIVGSGSSSRIYVDVAPEKAADSHVIYSIDSTELFESLSGATVGTARSVVSIACRGTTRQAVTDLGKAIRRALMDLNAEKIATGLSGGLFIDSVSVETGGAESLVEQPREGDDEWRYVDRHKYQIFHAIDA